MAPFKFKKATTADIPFITETLIAAEKSGSDILSYTAIFGLSEADTRKYIAQMLAEEEDGCELSVSSYLLAVKDGETAAAIGAWVERAEGIPSSMIKGNLLQFTLPAECIKRAAIVNKIVGELQIEHTPDTIQIGVVYVAEGFRGQNLVQLLIEEHLDRLTTEFPQAEEAHVQVFGSNVAAIKAYEKAGFKVNMIKESNHPEIEKYLPARKKVLMKRKILERR